MRWKGVRIQCTWGNGRRGGKSSGRKKKFEDLKKETCKRERERERERERANVVEAPIINP